MQAGTSNKTPIKLEMYEKVHYQEKCQQGLQLVWQGPVHTDMTLPEGTRKK